MKDKASTISLIVGLAIPVVMVILIALAVLLPGKSLNPTTDFVYVIGSYPTYTTREGNTITQHEIIVRDGTIEDAAQIYETDAIYPPYPYEKESIPRFFIHNTLENSNKEISIEEAKKLRILPEQTSPDGFTVSFGRQSYGVFPFFYNEGNSDTQRAYLSDKKASKEIQLISDTSANIYSFQLVGWVLK